MIEPLILEYENFKQNFVRHFRFSAKNDSSDFGKLKFWMTFYVQIAALLYEEDNALHNLKLIDVV